MRKQEEPPNGGSPLGRDKRGLSRRGIISSAPVRERAWPQEQGLAWQLASVPERAWLQEQGLAWQLASVPERAKALRPELVWAWPPVSEWA